MRLRADLSLPIVGIVFALLFTGILGRFIVRREWDFHCSAIGKDSKNALFMFCRGYDPAVFVEERFREVARRVSRVGTDTGRLQREWASILDDSGLPMESAVFDGSGNLLRLGSQEIRDRDMVVLFWKLFTEGFGRNWAAFRGHGIGLINAFGSLLFHPHRLLSVANGRLLPMLFPKQDGFMMARKFSRRGAAGVLLRLWETPSFGSMLAWNQRHRPAPVFRIVAFPPGQEQVGLGGGESANPDDRFFASIRSRLQGTPEGWLLEGNTLWTQAIVGGVEFVACRRVFSGWETVGRACLLFFALIAVGGGLICLGGRNAALPGFMSIRLKIPLLIAFSMFFPLMTLLFLGWQKIRHVEADSRVQVEQSAINVLQSIDQGYSEEVEQIRKLYTRISHSRLLERFDRPRIKRLVTGLIRKKKLLIFEARDANLRVVLSTSLAYPPLMDLYQSIAERTALLAIPHRVSPEIRTRQSGLLGMITEGDGPSGSERSLRDFEAGNDCLRPYRFGPHHLYWYFVFYQPSSHPLTTVYMSVEVAALQARHLRKALSRRYSQGAGAFRVFAFNRQQRQWFGSLERHPRELESLAWEAGNQGGMISRKVTWEGKTYWGMARPGNQLSNHILFALYPMEEIQAPAHFWRSILIWIGIFSVLSVVFLGAILSDTLLEPLQELTMAMTTLKSMGQGTPIKSFTNDELGDLAQQFNATLGKLDELKLAGLIQERLFPPPSLSAGPLRLVHRHRFATQLCGDLLDIVPLEGDRFLVVMADVAGHGVAAALLSAMVKAAIRTLAVRESDPAVLMALLDDHIRHLFGGKHLVACALARLDPGTGEVLHSSAGHPYGLLRSIGREIRELGRPHYPLGVRRGNPFQSERACIREGEFLTIFTDGAYEATSALGVPFGFDRFHRLIADSPSPTADTLIRDFESAIMRHRGSDQLADDLTILVIHRPDDESSPLDLPKKG